MTGLLGHRGVEVGYQAVLDGRLSVPGLSVVPGPQPGPVPAPHGHPDVDGTGWRLCGPGGLADVALASDDWVLLTPDAVWALIRGEGPDAR